MPTTHYKDLSFLPDCGTRTPAEDLKPGDILGGIETDMGTAVYLGCDRIVHQVDHSKRLIVWAHADACEEGELALGHFWYQPGTVYRVKRGK